MAARTSARALFVLPSSEIGASGPLPEQPQLVPDGEEADDPLLVRVRYLAWGLAGPAFESGELFVSRGESTTGDQDRPQVLNGLVRREVVEDLVAERPVVAACVGQHGAGDRRGQPPQTGVRLTGRQRLEDRFHVRAQAAAGVIANVVVVGVGEKGEKLPVVGAARAEAEVVWTFGGTAVDAGPT